MKRRKVDKKQFVNQNAELFFGMALLIQEIRLRIEIKWWVRSRILIRKKKRKNRSEYDIIKQNIIDWTDFACYSQDIQGEEGSLTLEEDSFAVLRRGWVAECSSQHLHRGYSFEVVPVLVSFQDPLPLVVLGMEVESCWEERSLRLFLLKRKQVVTRCC